MGMSGYWFDQCDAVQRAYVDGEITRAQFMEQFKTFAQEPGEIEDVLEALDEQRSQERSFDMLDTVACPRCGTKGTLRLDDVR